MLQEKPFLKMYVKIDEGRDQNIIYTKACKLNTAFEVSIFNKECITIRMLKKMQIIETIFSKNYD